MFRQKIWKTYERKLLSPISSHLSCLSTIFWSKQHFMTQKSRRMRDDRQPPSYVLMDLLQDRSAEVAYYAPYVPLIKPTREHPRSAGTQSVHWNRATIENFDVVLIATNHSSVNYRDLADWAQCIVDTETPWPACLLCPEKLESIGARERSEVTTTRGFFPSYSPLSLT